MIKIISYISIHLYFINDFIIDYIFFLYIVNKSRLHILSHNISSQIMHNFLNLDQVRKNRYCSMNITFITLKIEITLKIHLRYACIFF